MEKAGPFSLLNKAEPSKGYTLVPKEEVAPGHANKQNFLCPSVGSVCPPNWGLFFSPTDQKEFFCFVFLVSVCGPPEFFSSYRFLPSTNMPASCTSPVRPAWPRLPGGMRGAPPIPWSDSRGLWRTTSTKQPTQNRAPCLDSHKGRR